MDIHIIANPVSGGGRGERQARELLAALEAEGLATEVSYTRQAGDGEAVARTSRAECLVAVGGDGTVNEVLNGLDGRPSRLAVLPAGTANVVARELGVNRDAAALAAAIATGKGRAMDVGTWGDRRFLLGAGAGLDAEVVRRVSARRGRHSSLLKWVGPSLGGIFGYAYPKIRAMVDGDLVTESAQYAIVGNCRYSAGVFPATPEARPDDGLLDICLLHGLHPLRLLRLLAGVWRPGFAKLKGVTYLKGTAVGLEPAGGNAAPLQVDGDPAGHIPAEFGIIPRGVRMVAPER